jgi:uncharacterized protein (TIRG00374 family)
MSALFIGFFILRTDLGDMGKALSSANYFYVIPGIGAYSFALLWRTIRWKIILNPLGNYKVSRLWPVVTVGYAANNILPVRLGELVRAYYLNIREGPSKTAGLATILVERVFDGLALLFLVAIVSMFIPVTGLFQDLGVQAHVNWLFLTLSLSVPFFTFTAGLIAMAVWPQIIEGMVARVLKLMPKRIQPAAASLSNQFLLGLSALRYPRRLGAIFLFSVPVWLSEAAMYFLIALGFDLQDYFSSMSLLVGVLILTTATSNMGTSIPSTGGGVGPFEFFAQATLVFFSVDVSVASAYVLVLHAALLLPITILGVVYVWLTKSSLTELARASQVNTNAPNLDEVGSG